MFAHRQAQVGLLQPRDFARQLVAFHLLALTRSAGALPVGLLPALSLGLLLILRAQLVLVNLMSDTRQ